MQGYYEEVQYPVPQDSWASGGQDHKVKTQTKVTTKVWPPDEFFAQAETERSQRMRQQAEEERELNEQMRHEEKLKALKREALRRQEALIAFDREAATKPPPQPRAIPPARSLPQWMEERRLNEVPPKLSTKVVTKKWPPDNWFEEERRKSAVKNVCDHSAGGRPENSAVNSHDGTPRAPPPKPPGTYTGSITRSPPGPGSTVYPGQTLGRGGPHTPIPLDPNTRMYNPHGFWPYSSGQPRVQPPPVSMLQLREQLPPDFALGQVEPENDHNVDMYPGHSPMQARQGAVHIHQPSPHIPRTMAPPPASPSQADGGPMEEQPYELGDHFQCLGCGCHIKPSEVVYRPRTVPFLPPNVEHEPVPLDKPDGRPKVVLKKKPTPQKQPVHLPAMPEVLGIKDVENFDFDKARREGEYGIKTVENFDFDAARRQNQHDGDRVKAVEEFDFEGARQRGQAASSGGRGHDSGGGKIVDNFDFEGAPKAPKNPDFNFEAARAKVQAAAAARYNDW